VPATAVSSRGREAVELAASAGLVLDEWQAFVLERALGVRENGKWAAFEVGLVVPRQNGKGGLLEARELAGLFVLGSGC
jgi:phage terminase large subunit-like protein